jgi:hypothetical protein
VAAGAAVWSVRLAKQAVRAARETIELTEAARRDAEAARRDAEAARRDAERDRHRHRLVLVGEIVEDVFWAAEQDLKYNPATDGWKDPRNRLRHALVGLTEELPRCVAIVNAGGAAMAKGAASIARDEVEQALRRLGEGSVT